MPPTDKVGEALVAEYRLRATEVSAAAERSRTMERDFLLNKALNREANEAMADYRQKRSAFGVWLLEHHWRLFAPSAALPRKSADDLIGAYSNLGSAACFDAPASSARTREQPDDARLVWQIACIKTEGATQEGDPVIGVQAAMKALVFAKSASETPEAWAAIEAIRLAWAELCESYLMPKNTPPLMQAVDHAITNAMVKVGSRAKTDREGATQ